MKTKIYKALSVMLTLAVILSTCLCAMGTISAASDTYFVSATGDDAKDGKTAENAVASIAKAIELANAANATGTVVIKTIGETVTLGTLPAYTFDLVVESADPAVKTKITADPDADFANNEGKTTTYRNVTIAVEGQWKSAYLASSNIAMEDGAAFSGSFLSLYSGTGNDGAAAKSIAGMNMKIGADLYQFGLSAGSWSGRTYTEDYNLEVTGGNMFLGFNAYSSNKANGTTNYKKNVNIALTGGTGIRFFHLDGAIFEGAIQVIDSANIGFDKTYESGVTSFADPSIKDALAAVEADKYFITNATGIKDLLSFTDTAGKYVVNGDMGRYTIKATSADGTKSATAKDGVLDLTELGAGEYTVSKIKEAETVTYYVASEADGGASTNNGKTADKPLLTVAEVITAANEYGVTATDTVLVKVVGTTANATWGADVKCNAGTIKVVSNDLENLSTIATTTDSVGTEMGGLVEFDNIKIQGVVSSGNPDRLIANGRSISFGANAVILKDYSALFPSHQLSSYNNTLTYTIKNAFKGRLYLTHWNNNAITYKGDLNYIVDNAKAAPSFQVATAYDTGGPNKINGNLNIAIYDASSVTFGAKKTKATSHYVISGALQVITPGKLNADITNLATIGQNDAAPAGGVYHIINATNVPHVVELTNTVGTYKINADLVTRDLVLIDGAGNSTAIEGDKITVAAGTYKVAYAPAQATYYVGTSDDPEITTYTTVADAIAAAIQAGYADTDTVTIKVLGDVVAGAYPAYTFDLIIEGSDVLVPADPEVEGSVDSTRPTNIDFTGYRTLANNEGKTTTYRNVTIVKTGDQYPDLGAYSSNLVMEDTVRYSAGYLTIEYGSFNDGTAAKTIAGQTVEINGNSPVYVNLSNTGWSGRKYTDMISLILNIKNTNAPVISFNAGQGGSTTYEDVFINIKQTDGIKEFSFSGATIEGNLYILNSAGINLNEVTGFDARPANTFVLNNTTGIKDIVTPTNGEYDGEFIINFESETQQVVITDAEGAPVVIEDGYFYLEEAGEYTIALECIEHAYDNACDADCNVCGATRTPADHVYDNACDADCNVCGATRTAADHVYDDGCDVDCNECGATRTTAHVYDNDCDADCNECGDIRTPADHVYDNACDADCNECGETRVPADHVYDNACDADCNECGETRTPADHVYDNGCDVDCNVCGDIRTTAHDYDNNCDAECNECGETRVPADHVYDNDCDADCNECGETRTPADHVYDNACDADCNECGDIRTPADHVYDNACDADCNVCGATRTPADHVYDDNSDTDCNECGATRELGAQLIEEDGVTYYYYDGVKSDKTGLVEFEGKKIYINKGRFFGATGIVTVDGKKVYVRNGEFLGATGIVTINGKKMYIRNGYFLGATGLVTLNGKKMYIRNGYFLGATGIVTLNGKKLYIRNGYFLGASGTVSVGGKTYKVVKGIVQ